ncbi:unnamed protein product [Phyllotreta striolata]|uniref:Uncharacterized protein n=1 Tax=Phyllotreta striolata TaxID=444603 RepID=A0A9N9TTG7_PHYSR|nr:unnamed protein product [Phyllotreta striolata]
MDVLNEDLNNTKNNIDVIIEPNEDYNINENNADAKLVKIDELDNNADENNTIATPSLNNELNNYENTAHSSNREFDGSNADKSGTIATCDDSKEESVIGENLLAVVKRGIERPTPRSYPYRIIGEKKPFSYHIFNIPKNIPENNDKEKRKYIGCALRSSTIDIPAEIPLMTATFSKPKGDSQKTVSNDDTKGVAEELTNYVPPAEIPREITSRKVLSVKEKRKAAQEALKLKREKVNAAKKLKQQDKLDKLLAVELYGSLNRSHLRRESKIRQKGDLPMDSL